MPLRGVVLVRMQERGFGEARYYRQAQKDGKGAPHGTSAYITNCGPESRVECANGPLRAVRGQSSSADGANPRLGGGILESAVAARGHKQAISGLIGTTRGRGNRKPDRLRGRMSKNDPLVNRDRLCQVRRLDGWRRHGEFNAGV